jgi:ribosomal protein L33
MNIMPCNHTKIGNVFCGIERWLECRDCGSTFYCRSKHKRINQEDMYDRLCSQKREIQSLREHVKMLSDKLNELYYAPGMPGYISVKNDFESKAIKS